MLASLLRAGLTPETVSAAFTREDADAYINTNTYIAGTALLFSNCNAFVSAGTTQDLTGVAVVLRVGNEYTNFVYSATVASAANGAFWGLINIPTFPQLNVPVQLTTTVQIQCTLTNAATAFTYRGSKLLTVRAGLAR
jgi:hypothetical protein